MGYKGFRRCSEGWNPLYNKQLQHRHDSDALNTGRPSRKKSFTFPSTSDKVYKGSRYTQKLYRDTTHLYTKLHLSPRFTHFQKGPLPLALVIVISKVCTSKNHRKKNIPISPHSNTLTKASSPRNFFIFLLCCSMGLYLLTPMD